MKRILSFFLVLSLVFSNYEIISFAENLEYETELEADGDVEEVSELNTQSMYWNFNQNYTLTGTPAADVVTVASAQIGRSQSSLGYTEAWCADFVCDVGRLAGVPSNVIPWEYSARGGVSYLYNYMLNNCGATVVSSRQPGDFVFYYCNSCYAYCHVGIVADSSYQIEGNMWHNGYSQVYKYNTYYQDENGHSAYTGTISRIYVRPNYSGAWYSKLTPVNLGDNFYATILNNKSGLLLGNVNDNLELVETDGENARWNFVRQSDGSYIIYNCLQDTKVIDVSNGDTASGTNVQVTTKWGDDNTAQKWFIYDAGGGEYVFRPKSCGNVLDVYNGDTAAGTNLWIYSYNNSEAQKFMISQFDQVGTPTLSVNKGDSKTPTVISWTQAENARYYNLHIKTGSAEELTTYKNIWNLSDTTYTITLPEGYYEVYVEACNSYTNQESNTVTFTVKGDTTAPVIDEDSLTVTQLNNNQAKIRVKVTDNVAVDRVIIRLYKMEVGNTEAYYARENWYSGAGAYNNGYYELIYDGSLGKLGVDCPMEVELGAYDTAGNWANLYMLKYHANQDKIYTNGTAFFVGEGEISVNLKKGQSMILTAPENSSFSKVEWYTTDPDVVSVALDGTITGLKRGKAIVLAIRYQANGSHYIANTYEIVVNDSKNPFADVCEDDYYYNSVIWAVEEGITSGTSQVTFSPIEVCTRGQVVTFLWRASGSPEPVSNVNPFKDIKESDYYYKAVLWAVEKRITQGTSETTFSPKDSCTRGQVVTFLWRAECEPEPTATLNPFADVISKDYYYKAVLWAVEKGITQGTGAAAFGPKASCTRAQIVTFLYRAQ